MFEGSRIKRKFDEIGGKTSTKYGQYYPSRHEWTWMGPRYIEGLPRPIVALTTSVPKDGIIMMWIEDDKKIWASDTFLDSWYTDPILTNQQMIKAGGDIQEMYFLALPEILDLLRLITEQKGGNILSYGLSDENWINHNPCGKQFVIDCVTYCYQYMTNVEGIRPQQRHSRNGNYRKRN